MNSQAPSNYLCSTQIIVRNTALRRNEYNDVTTLIRRSYDDLNVANDVWSLMISNGGKKSRFSGTNPSVTVHVPFKKNIIYRSSFMATISPNIK